jgi:4-hydroxy-3-polyprenylbenzoate decarboxylase
MSQDNKTIIVGITGASGVLYAQRLVDVLSKAGCQLHVIATEIARQLFVDELGITELTAENLLGRADDNLSFYDNSDMFSRPASGSFRADGMVICPCSSNTLASVACGQGNTLLLRSAYVTLKQRRRLILVHRETPLTSIDLENMLKVTQAGGIICPANPGFYMAPATIADLVDYMVGRICDLLEVNHNLSVRWGI